MSSTFDFEGGDMVYDVHWSTDEGRIVIEHIYAGKSDVMGMLFDDVMEAVWDAAVEEYWRQQP